MLTNAYLKLSVFADLLTDKGVIRGASIGAPCVMIAAFITSLVGLTLAAWILIGVTLVMVALLFARVITT